MDIRSLAQRGYTAMVTAAHEELAMHAFLRGLRPDCLREQVQIAAVLPLLQALYTAERVEIITASTHGERPERALPTQRR